MKTDKAKGYHIFYTNDSNIIDNGTHTNTLSQLQTDFPNSNWAIIPADEVPEDWQDMTVKDGKLIKATAEVIEARRVARLVADIKAVDSVRRVEYIEKTDPLMIEALEAYATAHPEDTAFTAWLTAKEKVKQKRPKPSQPKTGQ